MVEFVADTDHPVVIPSHDIHLDGLLHIPPHACGVVLFAHGSGSSRFSPRNQYIANVLQKHQFATLLFDLLTPQEEHIDTQTREYRFNIELLAERLLSATNWILNNPVLHKLAIGYFGASTGGGAALMAAGKSKNLVKAVVSRCGRPDLAGEALSFVEAATLLIVGGNDEVVIELNQQAFEKLHCTKALQIVPGASHLFEESGKLEEVASLASTWFVNHLR